MIDIEETDVHRQGLLPSGAHDATPTSTSSGYPRSDSAQTRNNSIVLPSKKEFAAASSDGRQIVPAESPGTPKSSWTTTATPASPTVQEGFFNAITKRLQQVESNLTLSLGYVEDISLRMRDLLQQAEQKQLTKLTMFLGELNQTVLTELRKVQDQYDQVWQSTILALESQRDQSERDIVALSTRLNVLADEVVFQKRMAIGVPIPYLSPLQEQSGTASYTAASPSSTEAHRLYTTNMATPNQQDGRGLADRYFSLDATSKSTNATIMRASEPRDIDHGDDFPSPPTTPGLPENGTYSNIHAITRDTRASSLRHPVVLHHNSRKPLPSLPEHSVPTDSS
ncbi:hypothetical protein PT974_10234 [Cladobotryum mycophilum]|uniref:Biogenesis of lysosome-related organelles complex 1 subunit CNL1 n=1 Tax=Cladobotryum mycophilum TaxID=491253 RepID=A0ABR0SAD6_9HYPO